MIFKAEQILYYFQLSYNKWTCEMVDGSVYNLRVYTHDENHSWLSVSNNSRDYSSNYLIDYNAEPIEFLCNKLNVKLPDQDVTNLVERVKEIFDGSLEYLEQPHHLYFDLPPKVFLRTAKGRRWIGDALTRLEEGVFV